MSGAHPLARDGAGRGMIVVGHQRARNSTTPPRRAVTHTYAALAFFTGGRARLELNGEWTLRPGDVLLVPPGAPHRMLERKEAAAWMLGFCAPCVAAAGGSALLAPFERVRDGAAAVVNIPRERRAFLESLLRELEPAGELIPLRHRSFHDSCHGDLGRRRRLGLGLSSDALPPRQSALMRRLAGEQAMTKCL